MLQAGVEALPWAAAGVLLALPAVLLLARAPGIDVVPV